MKKLIKSLEKKCVKNCVVNTKIDVRRFHIMCKSVQSSLRGRSIQFNRTNTYGFCDKKKGDEKNDKKNDDPKKETDPQKDDQKEKNQKKDEKSSNIYDKYLSKYFSKEETLYIKKNGWAVIIASFLIILSFLDVEEKEKILTNMEFIDLIQNNALTKISFIRERDSAFTTILGFGPTRQIYKTEILNFDVFVKHVDTVQVKMGKSQDQMIMIHQENHRIQKSMGLIVGIAMLALFTLGLKKSGIKKTGKIGKDPTSFLGIKDHDIKDFSTGNNKVDIKFDQVAGMESAKREIVEFVDFLKNPEKYTKLGAKIPKGALLVGPPGTGKTLLAKATAGEAGVPFFAMSGSEFVEMFVGVGASRVRKLFTKAKEKSPSIIFIDEIDAIGKSRNGMFQNDEKDNTLNQLLVEMDGFGTENNVIVLAATNFSESLDPALLRPGRFDRKVEVMLPDIKERQDILNIYLKKVKLNPEKSIEDYSKRLATLTPGFSGADISNLVNEAAIISARNNLDSVGTESFEKASERVIAGMETKRPLDDKTKRVIAIHESGHAIVSWMQEFSNPLVKVTIIPRSKGALGFNQFMSDDKSLHSKEYLLEEISTLLGGRVAEEILLGQITTGASNDLERVTKLAHSMVTLFGMTDLGLQSFKKEGYIKPFSTKLEEQIDSQVNLIIDECLTKTRKIITENKELVKKLTDRLIEKETLDIIELMNVLGERPYPLPETVQHYLEEVKKRELEKENENLLKKEAEIIPEKDINKNI